MSNLENFLGKKAESEPLPDAVVWHAAVMCQFCNEPVDEQKLYPSENLLVWKCSKGHRSFIENYSAF